MFLTISMPFHQTFSRWFGRAPSNWVKSGSWAPHSIHCVGEDTSFFTSPFFIGWWLVRPLRFAVDFNGEPKMATSYDLRTILDLFFGQISLGSCTFRASHWSANLCCPSCVCCALATLGHGDVGRGARGASRGAGRGAAGAADGGEVQPTSWGKGCPGWK